MKIMHATHQILVTKKELKAASVFNSEAYKLLMDAQAAHPTFEIKEIVPQPKKRKPSNKGLTYQYMFDYLYQIGDKEGCDHLCKNWAKFNNGAMKEHSSQSYKEVKAWFEKRITENNATNANTTAKEDKNNG